MSIYVDESAAACYHVDEDHRIGVDVVVQLMMSVVRVDPKTCVVAAEGVDLGDHRSPAATNSCV